jgi:Asp-tRNA(Asn)/Glu-tRNA(Gln) amidotransferase B subunit
MKTNSNQQSINYLVGQVMKITKGRADPLLVRRFLNEILETRLLRELWEDIGGP